MAGDSDKTKFLIVLCLAILSVIMYSVIGSAVDPTLELTPTDVYETTTHTFNLTINNYEGDYEIVKVKVVLGDLDVESIADYTGWSENFDGAIAEWYNGSIATNVLLALFQLNAKADQVDENISSIIEIITAGPGGDNHTYEIPLTIINDDSAPEITNAIPDDGDYIKEGIIDQAAQIDAVDPETGIRNVAFNWTNCDQGNDTNNTPPSYSSELENAVNNTYASTVDLSEYENEDEVCFTFEAESNGGEVAELNGKLIIDGEAPTVSLDSPEDEALINAEAEFQFTARDNLAETLDCDFYNDDNITQSVTVENGVQQTIPAADAEEGVHEWKVLCADKAGWETESETRMYILDKTPPEIVHDVENGSVISYKTIITFNVSDNYQLKQVEYIVNGTSENASESFAVDPYDWPEGPNTVTVVAEDVAGNVRISDYVFTVDRTAPIIDLVSPENDSDVHVKFTFTASDNYDPTVVCELIVDNATTQTSEVNTNDTGVFTDLLSIGNHSWRVECTDDAENTGFSGQRTVTVLDLSGPDMVFNHQTTYYRGDVIVFNVTITDPSGVEDVDATLEMPDDIMEVFLLERDGYYVQDWETDANTTLGQYVLDVFAKDPLGHTSNNQSTISITYRYVVNLGLDDSSIELGDSVTASGTVLFDNGSLVPETSITLQIPNGDVEVPIGEDGSFTYTFTPNDTGEYKVVALMTPDNNITFDATEILTVSEKAVNNGGGSSGGGHVGSSSGTTTSTGCSPDWDCGDWSDCSNSNKYRTCSQSKCGDRDATKTERRACYEPKAEPEKPDEEPEPTVRHSTIRVNDTRQDNIEQDDEPVKRPGRFGSIGRAFGFLTGPGVGLSLFIVVLIALALIALLFVTGWSPTKKASKQDLFGNYFESRKR